MGRKRDPNITTRRRRAYDSNARSRDRAKAAGKAWACTPRDTRQRLPALYGITPEDYDRLVDQQGGRCAICSALPTRGGRPMLLHVDHDHRTGRVRGLLCNSCNLALGLFRDDIAHLVGAIAYLHRAQPELS